MADPKESQSRFHPSPADLGGAATWEWNIREGRLFVNERFATLYGLPEAAVAEGIEPNTFFSIIHPQDRSRIRLAVGGMLRGTEVFSKEFRILASDGEVRWVQARGRCHYDEQEQPQYFTGSLVDITDQKRIEERLRIAQSAGGVGTFEYVEGFATVSVSTQFCKLLGLNLSTDLPVRTVNALVHAGDAPIIEVTRASRHGPTQADLRITRPDDGESRWIRRKGEFIRDAEFADLRFIGVIYDITDAKRVEEQLLRLNDRLEQTIDERTRERDRVWQLSRDLYLLCDRTGHCRNANPAWLNEFGYDLSELIGRLLNDLIHPEDRGRVSTALSRISRGDYIENVDARVISKAGDYRLVSWMFVLEGDSFFCSGRDITHRYELEEQLRQSQKMEALGQLTGGIAHDFNNLLTGINGSLDIINRRMKQGRFNECERYMEAAIGSAQRAAALTHRLLAFSRRQSLDTRPLDANELVGSMDELLNRTLGEQIELSIDLQPDLWPSLSDANQLENALLNMAINARDAMPMGGKLTIATRNFVADRPASTAGMELAPGDYVRISVADTGSGMSPATIAKAFDPFFTTKAIGHGTGLGLSMIYGFAKQSDGDVRILSEVDVGTTVELYLPRFKAAFVETTKKPATVELPRANGETVLVVEDEFIVRMLVVEELSDLGYDVIEAGDSTTALKILESSRPIDLLVTDVGLPGINGRDLAERARAHRPSLKVIFMTGYSESAAVRSNFLATGMDMISKPFMTEDLAKRINLMLAK